MYYQGYRPPPSQLPSKKPAPRKSRTKSQNRRLKRGPVIWVTLILVAAGAYLGYTAWTDQKEHQKMVDQVQAYQDVFLPNIFVDGIGVGGLNPQTALDKITASVSDRQNSWNLSLTYQGFTFVTLNKATLGIQTDPAQVYSLLEEAYQKGHTGTLEDRLADIRALQETPYSVYTTQSEMTDYTLNSILQQIQQYFEASPTNASLVFFSPETNWDDPFGIQPETYGRHLDIDSVKEKILTMAAAGESGSIELTPEIIMPQITEADIRARVSLRAEGITPVASSSTTARTDNIRVALSRYNGLMVAPGEKISFNSLVGARTMENGFQYAIEYANGLNAWGIGGGVCQASTTVYLAALQSGLEIVNRTSHSDAVSYTTFGQDATVYYSGGRKIDFAFRNSTDAPVYIAARVENVKKNTYQCVVRIYGLSMEGVSYTLRTETVETIPASLIAEYQKDTNHEYVTYTDEEPYLLRKARDGFINVTYLQRWENGTLVAEKEISRDECKARGTLYLTGTEKR